MKRERLARIAEAAAYLREKGIDVAEVAALALVRESVDYINGRAQMVAGAPPVCMIDRVSEHANYIIDEAVDYDERAGRVMFYIPGAA